MVLESLRSTCCKRTHLDSSDWLRGSHITQYRCASRSTVEGTMRVHLRLVTEGWETTAHAEAAE